MVKENETKDITEAENASKSDLSVLLCGCNGSPLAGVVCGLVSVGGKQCKAPNDYACVYKSLASIDGSLKSLDKTINDARYIDPEFYKELQSIFNT